MIKPIYEKIANFLEALVLDKTRRQRMLFLISYVLIGIIAFFMTVVNIMTEEYVLMLITLSFSLLCIIDILFNVSKVKVLEHIARYLFAVEMLALFTVFLITGNPDGFSVIWMAMLPTCGLLLYEILGGSILCGCGWALLIFFFWTPWGQGIIETAQDGNILYTETFMLRFPLLYLAFFGVALALAAMLYITQRELTKLYSHDPLTKVYNRTGFDESVAKILQAESSNDIGFIIGDIDHFKQINDTYGHFAGDKALQGLAKIMQNATDNPICRWGGEEFAIFVKDGKKAGAIAEEIRKEVEKTDFVAGDQTLKFTISFGFVTYKSSAKLSSVELCKMADDALYIAKTTGRNKVCEYRKA